MLVFTSLGIITFLTLSVFYAICVSALASRRSPIGLLRPFHFFLIQFMAYFIFPMLAVLVLSVQIPGLPYMSAVYANMKVVGVLTALTSFYIVVCITYVATRPNVRNDANIESPSQYDLRVALTLFVIGTAASAFLSSTFSEGPRSHLVKSVTGQVLYGLTFMQTAGFLVYSLHLALARRYVSLFLLCVAFAVPLFLLGGRGRVLWPLVISAVLYMAVSGRMFSLYKIAGMMLCLFIGLFAMDPLLSAIHVGSIGEFTNRLPKASSLIYDIYLERRNFDGFYNFAVIVYYDDVPHSVMYFVSGVRDIFMGTYFHDAYSKGFGYPAAVPGTLWLAGGFIGLVIGGVAYGLLLVVFEFLYFRARASTTLALMLYLSTVIANPGSTLTDNLGKILACVLAFSPYYIARALTRRPRYKSLPSG